MLIARIFDNEVVKPRYQQHELVYELALRCGRLSIRFAYLPNCAHMSVRANLTDAFADL